MAPPLHLDLPRIDRAAVPDGLGIERGDFTFHAAGPGIVIAVQPDDDGQPMLCIVHAEAPAGLGWARSDVWLTGAELHGSWAREDSSILGPTYLSTLWREPRLAFTRYRDPEGAFALYILEETGLEV